MYSDGSGIGRQIYVPGTASARYEPGDEVQLTRTSTNERTLFAAQSESQQLTADIYTREAARGGRTDGQGPRMLAAPRCRSTEKLFY